MDAFASLPVTATNRPYLPRIDYSVDDLRSVRARLLARLPEVLPGWNPALAGDGDYGALIAELFAHMTATLDGYYDHRANEGFLRTATLARSLIDLTALMDYRLGAGASASAMQAFIVKDDTTGRIPAGFKLVAQPRGAPEPLVFETMSALDVHPSRNRMRLSGFDRSSRLLRLRAVASVEQDDVALTDGLYPGLKAGDPIVLEDLTTLAAIPISAATDAGEVTTLRWARGISTANRDYHIVDLALHGRPDAVGRLAAALRADEVTIGHNVLPVANAAMFSVGGAVLVESGGLRFAATVLAATQIAPGPMGTIALNRGVPASLRRSATRVLEGTSCGYSTASIRAGETALERDSLGGKKKDFPHTPNPGDLLLIVDASGVELATVASATGTTIVLTQPLPRVLRPTPHAFDSLPAVRFFLLDANSASTHQTTLRPVLLGELSGVYAGGETILTLDRSVDGYVTGDVVALSDGNTFSSHRITRVESVDARTRLTLAGTAPASLRVALLGVHGAFAHRMRVRGHDHADGQLAAGAAQLDLHDAPAGVAAGMDLVIADDAHAEGARVAQVQPLADRVRVALSRPLDHAYALGDAVIYGNVARVTHGASAPDEILGDGDPSVSPQRFALRRNPLAWIADPTAPRGVSPALEVFVNDERWTRVETLAESGPLDRHYAVEIDDRERATVVFGVDGNGLAPASGRNNIVARYRVGRGALGNVTERAIRTMPQPTPFVDDTFNPVPASGGADREANAEARRQAALRVRTLDRAVSLADYADLALSLAGIAKTRADVEREGTGAGARRVIVVTCAAVGGTAMSTPQQEAVLAAIQSRSAEPQRIRVRDHRGWPVRLALTVRVRPAFEQATVQRALLESLGAGPGGFFDFDRRGLGADLTLSSVYATAERTAGVDHVLATLFHAEGETPALADSIPVPADAVATGGSATDAATGRLTLHLVGGIQ